MRDGWVCHLMSAFVAFARTGNPNKAGMPEWRPFEPSTRATPVVDRDRLVVDDYVPTDRIAGAALQLDRYNRSARMTYRD